MMGRIKARLWSPVAKVDPELSVGMRLVSAAEES